MSKNLYLDWSHKQYVTNIPIIDEQHRALVSTINSLFFLARHQHATKAILSTLAVLQEFADTHFLTEEILMEMTGYTLLETHKAEHDELRAKLKILFSQSRQSLDLDALLFFLKKWWTEHVTRIDRTYATQVSAGLRKLGKL